MVQTPPSTSEDPGPSVPAPEPAPAQAANEPAPASGGDGYGSKDGKNDKVNWRTVAVSVLTSLVVAGATLLATQMTNRNDVDIQAAEIEAQREEAARLKREEIYLGFLDAVDGMTVRAEDFEATCLAEPRGSVECNIVPLVTANGRLQHYINMIYIYGTPLAIEAMRAVAATIPSGPASGFVFREIDDDRFGDAYSNFIYVTCLEVRPDPNQPCL